MAAPRGRRRASRRRIAPGAGGGRQERHGGAQGRAAAAARGGNVEKNKRAGARAVGGVGPTAGGACGVATVPSLQSGAQEDRRDRRQRERRGGLWGGGVRPHEQLHMSRAVGRTGGGPRGSRPRRWRGSVLETLLRVSGAVRPRWRDTDGQGPQCTACTGTNAVNWGDYRRCRRPPPGWSSRRRCGGDIKEPAPLMATTSPTVGPRRRRQRGLLVRRT